MAYIVDSIGILSSSVFYGEVTPRQQEAYAQNYGFILYSKTVYVSSYSNISPVTASVYIMQVRDRAHVFIDGICQGVVYRANPTNTTITTPGNGFFVLSILVENMGRINYGHAMNDPKGIVGDGVYVDGKLQTGNWTVNTLPLEYSQLQLLQYAVLNPKLVEQNIGPIFMR